MNRKSLDRLLKRLKVPDWKYSLDGNMCENHHEIVQEDMHKWSVYYCERGQRCAQICFTNENDACEELLARLIITTIINPGIKADEYGNKMQ